MASSSWQERSAMTIPNFRQATDSGQESGSKDNEDERVRNGPLTRCVGRVRNGPAGFGLMVTDKGASHSGDATRPPRRPALRPPRGIAPPSWISGRAVASHLTSDSSRASSSFVGHVSSAATAGTMTAV
jgi:hypothetical protein